MQQQDLHTYIARMQVVLLRGLLAVGVAPDRAANQDLLQNFYEQQWDPELLAQRGAKAGRFKPKVMLKKRTHLSAVRAALRRNPELGSIVAPEITEALL
jgi:hypothetical protein